METERTNIGEGIAWLRSLAGTEWISNEEGGRTWPVGQLAKTLIRELDDKSWVIVPRDEIIEGLRANVSSLQGRLNRTQKYADFVTAKNDRRKAQARLDRAYIDELKSKMEDAKNAIERHMEKSIPLRRDDQWLMDALAFLEKPEMCEVCGKPGGTYRGWHDEGSPMRTCEECGAPEDDQ